MFNKTKLILLCLLFGTAQAQVIPTEPDHTYYSDDDCFEALIEWPQLMYDDGYNVIQFRYYNYTTGGKVHENGATDIILTSTEQSDVYLDIDTPLLAWDVGACGLGLWGYQLRYGVRVGETFTVWESWEEYAMIWITVYEGPTTEPPNPPYLTFLFYKNWRYNPYDLT